MFYSKAPISEVIMGISYNKAKIPVDQILRSAMFSEEYPIVEIVQPIFLEMLTGFKVQTSFNPNSGSFCVRRWSKERKWLLQIQPDIIFLNWIRLDIEDVGTYPGFPSIKEKFLSILAFLEKTFKINMRENITICDLTYLDRVKWQSEISDLSEIGKIMHLSAPPKISEQGYNNVFSRYTFHDYKLNGFGLININTDTAQNGEQLLIMESYLRGKCVIYGDIETWFTQANIKQNNIFEQFFTKEIKGKWQ